MLRHLPLPASLFLVILVGCGGGGPSAAAGSGAAGGSGGSGGDASTSSSASGGGQGQGGMGGAGGQNQGGMGGAGGQGQGGMGFCVPGTPAPCYSGPPGTLGVGICAAGTKTCLDDGIGFSECTGEILPRVELAGTPDDENCSGGDDCSDKVIWSFRLGADVPPPPPQPQPYPYDEEIFAAAVTSAGDTLIHGRVYGTYEYAPGKTVGTGAFFMRIDPLGVVKNAFDLPSPYPKSVFATPDGGFFLFWSDLPGGLDPVPHYLARYDAADQLVYQKTFMIPTLRMASLVTLPDGHVLVLGSWRGSATLDAATFQGPIEYDSLYLAELDASGKWLWAKKFNQMDRASGNSLLYDAGSNDVYLSGSFGGYHVAGGISLGGDWLKAPVYQDGFYGRLTASSGHVWSKHVTLQGEAWGSIAAIAPDGSILLTGGDARQVPDIGTAIDLGLGIVDVDDARFLARVGSDGTTMSTVVTKAIEFGGLWPVAGGSIHFVSPFQSQSPVDVLGKPAASHSGSSDFMIGTIGATNELDKACIYGSASKETGRAAGISPDGSYVVVGSFEGALDLGKGAMTSVGSSDLFVAKIKP